MHLQHTTETLSSEQLQHSPAVNESTVRVSQGWVVCESEGSPFHGVSSDPADFLTGCKQQGSDIHRGLQVR